MNLEAAGVDGPSSRRAPVTRARFPLNVWRPDRILQFGDRIGPRERCVTGRRIAGIGATI
jgi:hypothetical protein